MTYEEALRFQDYLLKAYAKLRAKYRKQMLNNDKYSSFDYLDKVTAIDRALDKRSARIQKYL